MSEPVRVERFDELKPGVRVRCLDCDHCGPGRGHDGIVTRVAPGFPIDHPVESVLAYLAPHPRCVTVEDLRRASFVGYGVSPADVASGRIFRFVDFEPASEEERRTTSRLADERLWAAMEATTRRVLREYARLGRVARRTQYDVP